jgi:hypothetical protein
VFASNNRHVGWDESGGNKYREERGKPRFAESDRRIDWVKGMPLAANPFAPESFSGTPCKRPECGTAVVFHSQLRPSPYATGIQFLQCFGQKDSSLAVADHMQVFALPLARTNRTVFGQHHRTCNPLFRAQNIIGECEHNIVLREGFQGSVGGWRSGMTGGFLAAGLFGRSRTNI